MDLIKRLLGCEIDSTGSRYRTLAGLCIQAHELRGCIILVLREFLEQPNENCLPRSVPILFSYSTEVAGAMSGGIAWLSGRS
jgi:hypothetical protein